MSSLEEALGKEEMTRNKFFGRRPTSHSSLAYEREKQKYFKPNQNKFSNQDSYKIESSSNIHQKRAYSFLATAGFNHFVLEGYRRDRRNCLYKKSDRNEKKEKKEKKNVYKTSNRYLKLGAPQLKGRSDRYPNFPVKITSTSKKISTNTTEKKYQVPIINASKYQNDVLNFDISEENFIKEKISKMGKTSDLKNIPGSKLNEYLQFSFQNKEEGINGEKIDSFFNQKNLLQIFQTNGGFFFSNSIKKNGRFFARSKDIDVIRYNSNYGKSTKGNDMPVKGFHIKTTEDVLDKNSEYLKIFSSRIFPLKETNAGYELSVNDNFKTEENKNKQIYVPNNVRERIKDYSLRKDVPLNNKNTVICSNTKNKEPNQNHIGTEIKSYHRKKSIKKFYDLKTKTQINQFSNKNNNKPSPSMITKQGRQTIKVSSNGNKFTNNKKQNIKDCNNNHEVKNSEYSEDLVDELSINLLNKNNPCENYKTEANTNTLKYEKRTSIKQIKEKNEEESDNDFNIESPSIICKEEKLKSNVEFKIPKNVYSFCIAYGNHSDLVRKIIENKGKDWKEAPLSYNEFNFKWTPYSNSINYSSLNIGCKQVVNHFEFNQELTTKDLLFKNLSSYCELYKLNAFDYVPLTFILDLNERTYNSDVEKFMHCFNIIEFELKNIDKEDPLHRKKLLDNINLKLANLGISKEKRTIRHCKPNLYESHLVDKNLWLLKPTSFNRGRGVVIFDTIDQLKKLIKDYSEGREEDYSIQPKEEKEDFVKKFWEAAFGPDEKRSEVNIEIIKSQTFVVQKYIEQPLLINSRKFDMRIWVLLTNEMNVYFFKEGYIRTSSQEYNLNSEDRTIHLTNNAIQKISNKYGEFEEGNQLSFQMFQYYIDKNYPNEKIDVKKDLCKQIKEIVCLTMQSARKKINIYNREYCFELFGYDFFVDYTFKIWLIEVNTNPCLEESSKILKLLIPRLLSDTFKLTLDSFFPKKKNQEPLNLKEINYSIPGYDDSENLWEFLVHLNKSKTVINQRKVGF